MRALGAMRMRNSVATSPARWPNSAQRFGKRAMTADNILKTFELPQDGPHIVRSPIDGAEIGRVAYDDAPIIDAKIASKRRSVSPWRDVPAPRRGELVRLFGEELRANKDKLGRLVTIESRKDPAGRPRRSAGDDRHLRFRGRSVAPALRPDHRQRAAGPSHDGNLASGRVRSRSSRRSIFPSRCGPGTPRWRLSAATA